MLRRRAVASTSDLRHSGMLGLPLRAFFQLSTVEILRPVACASLVCPPNAVKI